MENKPESKTISVNDFEALMGDFAQHLKAKQTTVKKRKFFTEPTENEQEPTEIMLETFSDIYKKPEPKPTPEERITSTQKAQLIMDEIENLIQIIENHKTNEAS